jgi:anti-sigma factor RsiW
VPRSRSLRPTQAIRRPLTGGWLGKDHGKDRPLVSTTYIVYTSKETMNRRFERATRLTWAIMVLAMVTGIGTFIGGTMWGRSEPSERQSLIDDIAEYHQIYSREHRHFLKVPANQVEEPMAWLRDHVGRNIEAPDLTAAGLRFAGGRMLVINGGKVAELMYGRDDGLLVAVCISRTPGDNAALNVKHLGLQRAASWISGGLIYVVVGEFDAPTAKTLAALVGAQIEISESNTSRADLADLQRTVAEIVSDAHYSSSP